MISLTISRQERRGGSGAALQLQRVSALHGSSGRSYDKKTATYGLNTAEKKLPARTGMGEQENFAGN
jgi:hypothetical protein